MPIVELRKSGINLWEEYPDLDLIEEFRALREKEGDERSNNILKAIYYIWDPKSDKHDSGFTEAELIEDINTNLLGQKKFNWNKYEKVKQAWFKYCMTKTDKILKDLEDQMEGLNQMLKDWAWSQDTAKEKADVMGKQTVLLRDYEPVRRLFSADKMERDEFHGGYGLSGLEEEAIR